MTDYSISELRKIDESYRMVVEAQARPTAYKNLTPEQAEELAKLSPSYKSNQVWGITSNWICSVVNRMIKYRNLTFDAAFGFAKKNQKNFADFEKHSNVLKRDIQSFNTFEELNSFMTTARSSGALNTGLSKSAKNDGRARQCYSLMRTGIASGDFMKTYEDDAWLIGFPTNLKFNQKFSAIGKWCHTGSFGDAQQYWNQYAKFPIFYLLNKEDGYVLCASYQNGNGEIRDQKDNYPENMWDKGWDEYFTLLGLKKPMVDDIELICDDYEVPDDVTGDVYERVDEYEISERLFAGMNVNLEGDDYGAMTGNIFFSSKIDVIDPSVRYDEDRPNAFYTRYAANVDRGEFYTYGEFVEMLKNVGIYENEVVNEYTLRYIFGLPYFKELWNNAVDARYNSAYGGLHEIKDTMTMSSRFSTEALIDIVLGRRTDYGYDISRKAEDIAKCVKTMVRNFKRRFIGNLRRMLNSENGHGDISFMETNEGVKLYVSIDADEADHLSRAVVDGTTGISFERTPDILSLNNGGKGEFSLRRVEMVKSDDGTFGLEADIENCIATIKYICRNNKDLEGQQTFDLRKEDGTKLYYRGLENYG